MSDRIKLSNPKQSTKTSRHGWYRYYAGFSPQFVSDALTFAEGRPSRQSDKLDVLDPWLGAGTTADVALRRGHRVTGIDINPALVVIAKARMLRSDVWESLESLTNDILEGALRSSVDVSHEEPLLAWFGPTAAGAVRSIERSIFRVLMPSSPRDVSPVEMGLEQMSSLAAFYYVALFRIVRSYAKSAAASNPTWVRARVPTSSRARPTLLSLHREFRRAQQEQASLVFNEDAGRVELPSDEPSPPLIELGSSTSLNRVDESVDVVITSPPYCTRIDYVAAMRTELAVLGVREDIIKLLRHATLGNPTVPQNLNTSEGELGRSVKTFLNNVRNHPSKASAGYYLRYYETYFRMLQQSISEMHRVAKPGGIAFVVVQDSFYKEVRLDLAKATEELAVGAGWHAVEQFDFPVARTMAGINPRAKTHRKEFSAIESVLLLEREP